MPDKIVNHFVLADGSTAKYDAGSLVNLDDTVSLAGYAPDAKAVGDKVTELKSALDKTNEFALAGAKAANKLANVNEDGFYIADNNLHAVMRVVDGVLDALGFGSTLSGIISGMIAGNQEIIDSVIARSLTIVDEDDNQIMNYTPIVTNEDGLYLIDSDNHIIMSIKDNGVNAVFDPLTLDGDKIDAPNTTLIGRANKNFRNGNADYTRLCDTLYPLLALSDDNPTTKTVTLPSPGAHDKVMVKVGMHYAAQTGTPTANDIFFGGSCKTDFSDVRFFDSNGKMLKAELGKPVNMDLIFDTHLNYAKYFLSDGTLVGYHDGVVLSGDGGATWNVIAGTDVAGTASAVYHYTYMFPVFVDGSDNIFAYRGGKLYKIVAPAYTTITEVLDFSWDNDGTTVYPDIQPHAMDEDKYGNLYMGPYQEQFRTTVYKSTNGGANWSVSWASWDSAHSAVYGSVAQHVHHIHADPFSGYVYVGIDDRSTTWNGPIILKTTDAGATWSDLTETRHPFRIPDYYPSYFGDGTYKLGGGEFGGNAIVRSTDDDGVFTPVIRGFAGVRTFGDYGDDDLIVCGMQYVDYCSSNQIVISADKGKTWETIFYRDVVPQNSSGMGFRVALSGQIKGESEPCVLMCVDSSGMPAMKIYNGGAHYYREAYIMLENTTDTAVTITAKTGYTLEYPYRSLFAEWKDSAVYRVPLNEGIGRYVEDSTGAVAYIAKDYNWEKQQEVVRLGDYGGENRPKTVAFSSAIKLSGCCLNFGKKEELNLTKNYTITFWLNSKSRRYKDMPASGRFGPSSDNITYKIMSFGGIDVFTLNGNMGICERGTTNAFNAKRAVIGALDFAIQYNNNYTFVAIEVLENAIKASLNGCILQTTMALNTFDTMNSVNLKNADFVIGPETDNEMEGFVGDVRIYGKALTQDEITAIYKGYNI